MVSAALAQAWQQALAAEYAAVFGYGLLGPHLRAAVQVTLARTCQQQHETLATATSGALLAAGQTVVPPRADYPAFFPVTDDLSAQRLAIRIEGSSASAWRYLIAVAAAPHEAVDSSVSEVRVGAVSTLAATAVRAMRWRAIVNPAAPTVPFPGI
jgi:hypothetical protein